MKVHMVIRHPKNYKYLGRVEVSKFYEIVKVVPDRITGKVFCEEKNNNSNTRYHYAVKSVEVHE